MPRFPLAPALLLAAAACGTPGRSTQCGIAALAGPGLLLEELTRPGRSLDSVPAGMPEILPVRMAAGDAFRGVVGRTGSAWIVGVEGAVQPDVTPGFGVLLVDPATGPDGIVVFEGPPIPGAPVLGQVNLGAVDVPFHGLRATAASYQDARCPLFPDSLRT